MSIKLDYLEVLELAEHILGIEDCEDIDQALYENFEISFESFEKLISKLVPMCEVGQSPLSGNKYRGFADTNKQFWLVKINAEK